MALCASVPLKQLLLDLHQVVVQVLLALIDKAVGMVKVFVKAFLWLWNVLIATCSLLPHYKELEFADRLL